MVDGSMYVNFNIYATTGWIPQMLH